MVGGGKKGVLQKKKICETLTASQPGGEWPSTSRDVVSEQEQEQEEREQVQPDEEENEEDSKLEDETLNEMAMRANIGEETLVEGRKGNTFRTSALTV